MFIFSLKKFMKKIIAILALAFLASCGQTTNTTTTTTNVSGGTTTTTTTNEVAIAPEKACEVYFEKLSCSLKAQKMSEADVTTQMETVKKFIESQVPTEQAASCQASLNSLKSSNLLGNC